MPPPAVRQQPRRGPAPRDAGASSSSSSSSSSSDVGDPKAAKDTPLILIPAPTVNKKKPQAPQVAIDEFWGKFSSKTPGKATTILPKNVWVQKASEKTPNGTQTGQNAVASYEEAAKICKEKVAQIVKECRRVNQKYRDPHFDIEFDLKSWRGKNDCLRSLSPYAPNEDEDDGEDFWDKMMGSSSYPGSVKRVGDIFEKPQFYVEGATGNDVRQGNSGDCWFMAALCTLGNKPGLIDKVCVARDEQIGVYGFVFHRDGEWISEIIDDKLYLSKPDYDESWIERNLIEDRQRINSEEDYRKIYQTGSGALFFAQCEDPNETWLPLLEKAYAKAHGDYDAIEGGFTGEGLEDLTGGVTTELFSTDILDKDYFWKENILKVNVDFLFGCYAGIFGGRGSRKGVIECHAYSISKAVEIDGKRLCLLRNPWGRGEWTGPWSDGSKEWTAEWIQKLNHKFGDDGSFWILYEDLLKKYQVFDRTRLFSDQWKATQSWAALNVPWTVDYHDTKFSFTLEKKAQVVLVLSQLDARYFCGLEGQYDFELSFRLHKAGDEDYLIRSHGNYWARRSVTAELELEPGEYHVLIKVIASKDSDRLPVEQVVRNNAKTRSNKLMRIGLSYDLAHAKGQISESEIKKTSKKAEKAAIEKEKKETKEKLIKEKQKRKHNENKEKRKQLAAKEKRKAKAKAKEEKAAAEKAAADKEAAAKSAEAKPESETKTDTEEKKDIKEEKNTEEKKDIEEKTEEKKDNEVVSKDPVASDAAAETKALEVVKPAETTTAPESDTKAPEEAKPSETTSTPAADTSKDTSAPQSNEFPMPPIDDDVDSDIDSNISDITAGVLEDAIAEAKLLAAGLNPPIVPMEEEPDEFEADPWNAVAIVGLRVYCEHSGVSIKVVRPRDTEKEEKETPAEIKLDVDNSAADATKKSEDSEEKVVGEEEAKKE